MDQKLDPYDRTLPSAEEKSMAGGEGRDLR